MPLHAVAAFQPMYEGVGVLVVLIAGHVMANVNIPVIWHFTDFLSYPYSCLKQRVIKRWSVIRKCSIRVFYVSFLVIWDVRLGTRFGVLTAMLPRINFCGEVALCRQWAVGMWHCVVGELWDVALCRWAVGMWRCVVAERISALRGSAVYSSWDVKQSKNKYFYFETSEKLHLIWYSVCYWKSWTVSEGVLISGRNEKWYRRYWCRTFESGTFEGSGRCFVLWLRWRGWTLR